MMLPVSIISYRTSVLQTIATSPIQLALGTILISWRFCKIVSITVSKSTYIHYQKCCRAPLHIPRELLNDSNNTTYTPTISFGAGLQKYFGFSNSIVSKTSGQIAIDENGFMSIPASTTALQNAQTSLYINNSVAAKTYTFISDICPNITTVNSLVVDCNLINSKYNSERSNIFYSVPLSASFGNLITVGPFPPCLYM